MKTPSEAAQILMLIVACIVMLGFIVMGLLDAYALIGETR